MGLINVGVSGIIAHQSALQTTGHNVANTDTEGFSRQTVRMSTGVPSYTGAGYVGRGAQVAAIERVVDDFLVDQVRRDTTAFTELDAYLRNIGQVDSLLADDTAGLAPALQGFFSSLHGASDDPTSVPARQLILSQTDTLVDRFQHVFSSLERQNEAINTQLNTLANRVTQLAGNIAKHNEDIGYAAARGAGNEPNDLMDSRDKLIDELTGLTAVNVVPGNNRHVNIFLGSGQTLVLGNRSSVVRAVPGVTDPAQHEIAFVGSGHTDVVTRFIKGGELGGLLDFRERTLAQSVNGVGRLALALTGEVNARHAAGLDMRGEFGGEFFAGINSDEAALRRVTADTRNGSPTVPRMRVTIEDSTMLTTSDYRLNLPGPGDRHYVLTRLSDGVTVAEGTLNGAYPASIEADGFALHLDTGPIGANDKFLVQPTRFGARDIDRVVANTRGLAFASAVSGQSSLANSGTATIRGTMATDLASPAFATPGTLAPPTVIRFTSATSYDILDNTNPARPVDLDPPLRGLSYTPGTLNNLMPDSPGQTIVTSRGANAGRVPAATVMTPLETPGNGYSTETLTVTTTDPATGIVTTDSPVRIAPDESASSVAHRLSLLDGVHATARTRVTLSDFANAPDGEQPMEVSVNGVVIEVNQPLLNSNSLADAMATNVDLRAMGIVGRSDGSVLTLESIYGDDLIISLGGDDEDSVVLGDTHGGTLTLTGAGGSLPASTAGTGDLSAGHNFNFGGPYTLTLTLGESQNIQLDFRGEQVLGRDVVSMLQSAIDSVDAFPAGAIVAGMAPDGTIGLQSRDLGPGARFAIVGQSTAMADTFGFTTGAYAGFDVRRAAAVGGEVDVILEQGRELTSNFVSGAGNLFTPRPVALPTHPGYQVQLEGNPAAGDRFTVEFNSDGTSDNRNLVRLADIESARIIEHGAFTPHDAYASLVEEVGAMTSAKRINQEAGEGLLQHSESLRSSISGVNLDEEAANLVRFELGYNASAQVISVARRLFDTLISSFGG